MGSKKTVKRQSRYCNFFFVKPRKTGNADQTAKRLISIDKVEEVLITEGEYGFIVRAGFAYEDEKQAVNKQISKVVGGNQSKVVCYCQYSK